MVGRVSATEMILTGQDIVNMRLTGALTEGAYCTPEAFGV